MAHVASESAPQQIKCPAFESIDTTLDFSIALLAVAVSDGSKN